MTGDDAIQWLAGAPRSPSAVECLKLRNGSTPFAIRGHPRLRRLVLIAVEVSWKNSTVAGLQELELDNLYSAYNPVPLQAILRLCPDLEKLAIAELQGGAIGTPVAENDIVCSNAVDLPRLQTLSISDCSKRITGTILRFIRADSLACLSIPMGSEEQLEHGDEAVLAGAGDLVSNVIKNTLIEKITITVHRQQFRLAVHPEPSRESPSRLAISIDNLFYDSPESALELLALVPSLAGVKWCLQLYDEAGGNVTTLAEEDGHTTACQALEQAIPHMTSLAHVYLPTDSADFVCWFLGQIRAASPADEDAPLPCPRLEFIGLEWGSLDGGEIKEVEGVLAETLRKRRQALSVEERNSLNLGSKHFGGSMLVSAAGGYLGDRRLHDRRFNEERGIFEECTSWEEGCLRQHILDW